MLSNFKAESEGNLPYRGFTQMSEEELNGQSDVVSPPPLSTSPPAVSTSPPHPLYLTPSPLYLTHPLSSPTWNQAPFYLVIPLPPMHRQPPRHWA